MVDIIDVYTKTKKATAKFIESVEKKLAEGKNVSMNIMDKYCTAKAFAKVPPVYLVGTYKGKNIIIKSEEMLVYPEHGWMKDFTVHNTEESAINKYKILEIEK